MTTKYKPGVSTNSGLLHDKLIRRIYPGLDWKHIEDATLPFKLWVLAHHIAAADCKSSLSCAVAVAVKSLTSELILPIVNKRVTFFCFPRTLRVVRYMNPPNLRKQIISMDETGKFDPGLYVLLPPIGSDKLGVTHAHARQPTTQPRLPRKQSEEARSWAKLVADAELAQKRVPRAKRRKTG